MAIVFVTSLAVSCGYCRVCRGEVVRARVEVGYGQGLIVYEWSHLPDSSVRIAFRDGQASAERTIHDDFVDRYPGLVEATKIGTRVLVFIGDTIAPSLVLAFDERSGSLLRVSERDRQALRAAVRRRYSIGEAELARFGGDELRWAADPRSPAEERFRELARESRWLPLLR